jgi:hypothetical protein
MRFLHASIRHDRSRCRRSRTVTVLSVLLILALAGVSRSSNNASRKSGSRSPRPRAGRPSRRHAGHRTAPRLGIAAEQIHPDSETHASLVNTPTSTPYAYVLGGQA